MAQVFEFDDNGSITRLALGLAKAGPITGAKAGVLTARFGILLQTRVKANASGRPGPNAPTGDYRRSIGLQVNQRGATIEAVVGTNKAQGRRLEFGFIGEDALGRSYNQPAYPHFGPAADQTGPEFTAAATALGAESIDDALGGR